MTLRQTYITVPDTSSVFNVAMVYVKMLMVAREGVVYDIKTSINDIQVTSRQVHYNPSTGVLQFDANIPFNPKETVNIVYDTNI